MPMPYFIPKVYAKLSVPTPISADGFFKLRYKGVIQDFSKLKADLLKVESNQASYLSTKHQKPELKVLVLRPGFEPGFPARKAGILGRTILPEHLINS